MLDFSFTIFVLRVLVVNSQNEVDSSQVLEAFANSFLTSEDDFIDPAQQDNLFPFEKAKSKNLKIDKKYAENIVLPNEGKLLPCKKR